MTNLKITINKNPIIYSKTPLFLSSSYCKGNKGINNKILKQNNTGTFFERIIASKLNNVVPKLNYKKLNTTIYIPDIETSKSIISCKIQEGQGTAWQKLLFEAFDLEYITSQTNKKVVLLCSDYSWKTYFYNLEPYLKKVIVNVEICTETYFINNIKNYD